MNYPKKKKSVPSYKTVNIAGKVRMIDGVLAIVLNAPKLLRHFLKEYAKEGDEVSLCVALRRAKRTLEQNSYMHLYFSLIALSSGHTDEEIKAWATGKFLTKGISEVYEEKTRIVKHTSDLNISEMIEFLNRVEDRTGIPLPDTTGFDLPMTKDEYGKLKMIQKEKYSKLKAKLK